MTSESGAHRVTDGPGLTRRRDPGAAQMNAHRADADRGLFQRLGDQRDELDREVLVERYLPLARSIAARYQRRGEPFDDVFQVACVGLVNAVDRYDPSRGRAFSSFAVPTIAGEIKRYYRDKTWSVHVPRDLQDLALAVERARTTLEKQLARGPTVAEIADRVDVDVEDVAEALQAYCAKRAGSLDAPTLLDESSATVADTVAVHEDGFSQAEHRADLRTLARVLTRRERVALRLRFEDDLTQEEIGEHLGISQMQVSRVLRSSIQRLRDHSDSAATRIAPGSPRQ